MLFSCQQIVNHYQQEVIYLAVNLGELIFPMLQYIVKTIPNTIFITIGMQLADVWSVPKFTRL
jgi:hypothetical protein